MWISTCMKPPSPEVALLSEHSDGKYFLGAPLSELATNKSQTFKINDYNLGIKITDALAAAPTFLNGISP